jgi:putative endonuclease
MFYIYILKSQKTGHFYIGQTEDLIARLNKHNSGLVKSTKYGIPWNMILHEEYLSRAEAIRRELEIKSYKGGIKFKRLLGLL